MSHHRGQAATRTPPSAEQAHGGHPGPPGDPVSADEAVLRRTAAGWRVGATDVPDLTCAMVLADLFAAELGAAETADATAPQSPASESPAPHLPAPGSPAPRSPADESPADESPADESPADEARRLRATVSQLQHALTARIRVEQAIGVLAERHRIRPRQAFEPLRSAARNRGRRVIDIAADVVASASNPLLQLPDELARPRSGTRRGGRPRRLTDLGA
jgi:ANTAR domain